MKKFNLQIWVKAASSRAVKTFAQVALATIGAVTATTTFGEVNWGVVIASATLATVISLLMSLVDLPEISLGANRKELNWALAAFLRVARTMAQSAVGLLGAYTMITEVNWTQVTGAVILSGIFSVLTSLSGLPEVTQKNK